MKATELMRALESRPEALEAAAPQTKRGNRTPDISGVLGRIRGGQGEAVFRTAPAVREQKHPRLVPAMLTVCSIAACAVVVTGFAFLIRDSHEAVESSDAAMQTNDAAGEDTAFELVTEKPADAAAPQTETVPKTEPAENAAAPDPAVNTAKTEPVSGNVQTDLPIAVRTEPVSADNEAPAVTAKTVPTNAVRQQNNETLVRITYKIPNYSVLMPGMFHIELFNYADSKKFSGFDLFSGEPNGDLGIVEAVVPDGLTHFIAVLYNNESNKKAEIGTVPVRIQNGTVEPVEMNILSALDKLCYVEPVQTGIPTETPAFRTLEVYHDTPAPSFIYQWNSDQYQAIDTALHYESAAEWKNQRMSDGDRAIYAETNDGFRYLDEHADSVSYLWFMYEADGAVPEVRQMEISDQSGFWMKAALVPADVHGKVRVMIPLDEEFPAWIGNVTEQWRLELVENGTRKQDPVGAHWYWRIDQTSSIAPVG